MNHKNETKDNILSVAMKLFSEYGYEKTSVRMIAEAANITKPAVYYYFPDKESLYNGLIEHGMEQAINSLKEIADNKKPVKEQLIDVVFSRFNSFPDHPDVRRFISKIMTGEMNCQINLNMKNIFNKSKKELIKILDEGIKAGFLRHDFNKKQFIYCFIGAINIHSRDHFVLGEPKISKDEATELVDTLLIGILKK